MSPEAASSSVDLVQAVALLAERFGIRTLLLGGEATSMADYCRAGLVDEVSLLLLQGIDGRYEIAGVFDDV